MRDTSRTSTSHVSLSALVAGLTVRARSRLGRPRARALLVLQAALRAAGTVGTTRVVADLHPPTQAWRRVLPCPRVLFVGLVGGLVGCESGLLLISLVPQTIWAGLGHPDGPLPHALFPLVAGLFYLLPTLTGALCRHWPAALILATLPAWGDLGAFAVAAAPRLGPFYLAQDPHGVGTVGTLELFAALGLLGWIARRALRDLLDGRDRRKAAR